MALKSLQKPALGKRKLKALKRKRMELTESETSDVRELKQQADCSGPTLVRKSKPKEWRGEINLEIHTALNKRKYTERLHLNIRRGVTNSTTVTTYKPKHKTVSSKTNNAKPSKGWL